MNQLLEKKERDLAQKISYLSKNVIPRRSEFLNEILFDSSIPEGIRTIFVTKQVKLIISAKRDLAKFKTQFTKLT
jgi:hypothetical protein